MKKVATTLSLSLLFILSCHKEPSTTLHYKATSVDQRNTADLKITIKQKKFTGDYIITYFDNKKDSGTVQGELFGDTLKGRYDFISRDRSHFLKPIVLLKEKNDLKLGVGELSYFMNIPFYLDHTIQFKDSLFQFRLYKTIIEK